MERNAPVEWSTLLEKAINEPGIIDSCYSRFHDYSFGNGMLAMYQMIARGIAVGPIATFKAWQGMGRSVKRGEKGIVLCMPLFARKGKDGNDDARIVGFTYRAMWFALAQTEVIAGQEDGWKEKVACKDWDATKAMETLKVEMVPYAMVDGNCQGYAKGRSIAINPIATNPLKTIFHELAHVVLGHTGQNDWNPDHKMDSRSLREVEAECVAFILGTILGLPGADESRGYVQHWNTLHGGQEVSEKSAKAIFTTVDKILRAGQPAKELVETE